MNFYASTHKLAGNPKVEPMFPIPCHLKSGETITLTDPNINRALIACMDMNAVMGGAASHYGGPAAFAEINSVIFGYAFALAQKKKEAWYNLFHYVNDAGHCENGIYATKATYGFADLSLESLKAFRSIKSKLTGHGEAHIFPEGVLISNGPLGSAVAQAQGLAIGDKLANNKRVTVLCLSDGGAMEGEAKEALSSIPGLAKKSLMNPFLCILSDNNTKLSGRIDEDCFSMKPYIESLAVQGWHIINLEKGNDLNSVLGCYEEALESLNKNPNVPILIRAITVKGIGTEATEKSKSGGHGFPLKKATELNAFVEEILGNVDTPKEISHWINELVEEENKEKSASPSEPSEKIQVGVSKALINAKKAGLPVVSISSDLPGSTGLADFRKQFAESSFDVGIAEANMVSVGSGLSLSGFIPVVDTFAQFGVTKGSLPFIMSSLSQAPMIAIFSHIGFQDAADGASHQSLSYLSMLNSIPHLKTFCLSCSSEAEALVGQALNDFHNKRSKGETPDSYIFFLGRENFPLTYVEGQKYDLDDVQILSDIADSNTKKICLIPTGALVPEALAAAKILASENISCSVIHSPAINTPNQEQIKKMIAKSGQKAIVIEEHQKLGGFHSVLSQFAQENSWACEIHSLSVDAKFGQSSYTALELYEAHGLDKNSIAKKVRELLN